MYLIPILPDKAMQSKTVSFERMDGSTFSLQIRLRWMEHIEMWHMSLYNPSTGGCIVENIPLSLAKIPAGGLLKPFAYMDIGSAYLSPVSPDVLDHPQYESLSNSYVLVWEGDYSG